MAGVSGQEKEEQHGTLAGPSTCVSLFSTFKLGATDNLRSFLPSSFQTAVIYQMLVTSLYLRIGISERKGQDKKIHCTSMLKLSLPMNNFNTQFTHFYRKPSK